MTLHNSGVIRYQPHIQKEIEIAIHDLVEKNYFKPQPSFFGEGHIGPYDIRVFVHEGRVIIDISGQDKAKLGELALSVRPLKKVIKEYFVVCENYYEATKKASPEKIEAIDFGRRALHTDGSDRLKTLLFDKVGLDDNTARRLFTLICALHIRA